MHVTVAPVAAMSAGAFFCAQCSIVYNFIDDQVVHSVHHLKFLPLMHQLRRAVRAGEQIALVAHGDFEPRLAKLPRQHGFLDFSLVKLCLQLLHLRLQLFDDFAGRAQGGGASSRSLRTTPTASCAAN
jgi:hypothetical protein